jgi:hypothetical protein
MVKYLTEVKMSTAAQGAAAQAIKQAKNGGLLIGIVKAGNAFFAIQTEKCVNI